jgi:hypothetical protein
MTHTPATRGALVDRVLAEAGRKECGWTSAPTTNPQTQFVHPEPLRALLAEAAASLLTTAPASPADDVEIRLWDSQWVNVVNHADCYRDFDKEEAIAMAVKRTEEYMRKNYQDGKWPPPRTATPPASDTDASVQQGEG